MILCQSETRSSSVGRFRNEAGQLHREDGPASIEYRSEGSVLLEYYYQGQWHREDGPARIRYRSDGRVLFESYYLRGQLHREDGPAYIHYMSDGSVWYEEYYLRGCDSTDLTLRVDCVSSSKKEV